MLSPWTLPGGLPATSSNGLRPMSRRMSWLAASDIASPTSAGRSEEHTSELQSPCNLVCRLLLEKKKTRRPQPPEVHGAYSTSPKLIVESSVPASQTRRVSAIRVSAVTLRLTPCWQDLESGRQLH